MKTKTKERENQANKRQKFWREEEGGQEKEEKIEEEEEDRRERDMDSLRSYQMTSCRKHAASFAEVRRPASAKTCNVPP